MKSIFTTLGLFCSLTAAAQFTANNLVVLRVGDGSTALGTNSAQVSLVEFTKAGAVVGSALDIPSTTAGSRLVLQGNPGTAINLEGALRLSENKAFLTFAGYDADLAATAALTQDNTTKVIARVGLDKVVDLTTKITQTGTALGIRSVVSTDGTKFWFNFNGASSPGVSYMQYGGTATSHFRIADQRDWRAINIINGQLYGNVSNQLIQIGAITAATNSLSPLTSAALFTHNSSPSPSFSGYGFILFDLDATEAGYDVAYHLSQGSNTTRGLVKSIKVSGTWTTGGGFVVGTNSLDARALGTNPTNPGALLDVTGTIESGKVALYLTRGDAANNSLIKLVDQTGYSNTINYTFTHLASAGTGYTFKGVAFTPNSDVQTLPLKLKSFKASLSNNAGNLSWVTTDEVNTKQFTVERGVNADNFKEIAVIYTRNESGEQNYNYQDRDIQNGVNYYRLKISDQDGTYFYSEVKFIDNKLSKTQTTSVFPNPVFAELFINHEVLNANSFVNIKNSLGKTVQTFKLQTGNIQSSIDASKLVAGVYLLELNNGGVVSVSKFIKQ